MRDKIKEIEGKKWPCMDRIEQLKNFLKDEPDDSFLNYALAIEYVGRNDLDLAKDIFIKLIKNDPNYTATYYHLGKLYEQQGNKDEAESIYEEGIKLTRAAKEQHKLAELQSALTNMLYDDY